MSFTEEAEASAVGDSSSTPWWADFKAPPAFAFAFRYPDVASTEMVRVLSTDVLRHLDLTRTALIAKPGFQIDDEVEARL